MSIPKMEIPPEKIPEFLHRLAHMPKDWASKGGNDKSVYDAWLYFDMLGLTSIEDQANYATTKYVNETMAMYDLCREMASMSEDDGPEFQYSEANEIFHATLAYLYAEAWGLDIDLS